MLAVVARFKLAQTIITRNWTQNAVHAGNHRSDTRHLARRILSSITRVVTLLYVTIGTDDSCGTSAQHYLCLSEIRFCSQASGNIGDERRARKISGYAACRRSRLLLSHRIASPILISSRFQLHQRFNMSFIIISEATVTRHVRAIASCVVRGLRTVVHLRNGIRVVMTSNAMSSIEPSIRDARVLTTESIASVENCAPVHLNDAINRLKPLNITFTIQGHDHAVLRHIGRAFPLAPFFTLSMSPCPERLQHLASLGVHPIKMIIHGVILICLPTAKPPYPVVKHPSTRVGHGMKLLIRAAIETRSVPPRRTTPEGSMSIDRSPIPKLASTTLKQPAKTLIEKFIKLYVVAQQLTNTQVIQHLRIISRQRTTTILSTLTFPRHQQRKHTYWNELIQHNIMICTRLIMSRCMLCPNTAVPSNRPTWRFSMLRSPTFTDAPNARKKRSTRAQRMKDFINLF